MTGSNSQTSPRPRPNRPALRQGQHGWRKTVRCPPISNVLYTKLFHALLRYPHEVGDTEGAYAKFKWKGNKGWYRWPADFRGTLVEGVVVLHEAVHAYDFMNNWYASSGDAQNAEHLAYSTEWLVDRLHGVALAEKAIRRNDVKAFEEEWAKAWNGLEVQYYGKHDSKPWKGIYWSDDQADNNEGDMLEDRMLWDVNAKLGFRLSCRAIGTALARRYRWPKGCFDCRFFNLPDACE